MAVDSPPSPEPAPLSRPLARDRPLLWMMLSWALLAAAAFSLAGIVAFPEDPLEAAIGLGLSLCCVATAVVLRMRPERLPLWIAHAILAATTVAISIEINSNLRPANDDEILYLWVAIFVFYFLGRRAGLAHMALVAVGYWVAIFTTETATSEDHLRWLITIGTLTVAGLLVDHLAGRQDITINRLSEAVRTDALTGLLNRKGFAEAFAVALAAAERRESPFAVLVGDLDRFKLVNDRLGHAEGDETLKAVAALLDQSTRGHDRPARLGGEEFAVLASDVDVEQARQAAERLRAAIETAFAGHRVPVTISIGVAVYPEHGTDSDALMLAADRALYAAKSGGRNRVVIAGRDEDAGS
jgi:diguanylate cyclase (GGDEF)-like protein